MKKKLFLYTAILANLTLLLTNCTPNVANGGTEVGNPRISAMLYNPDGTPAQHASVHFYRFGIDPRSGATAVVSTTTDVNGNYTASLDTGTYNILASGGGNATFQDSITVVKDSTVRPPADTLKSNGGIKGIVQLEAGGDPTTVFVLFMGANVFTTVQDSAGNFATTSMAKGRYQVKFLSTLDNYKPKDTVLNVTAGTIDSLAGPIILQNTGIPTPTGLRIVYDTLNQIVTLIWNKPANGKAVQSYTVYRQRSDSASFVSIKAGVKDTAYNDSTGIQDMTYQYRVAVVDTNASEGIKSAVQTITITGLYSFALSFGPEGSTGDFTNQHGICFGQDSVILVADYQNSKIKRFTAKGHFLDQFGTAGTGDGQFDQVWDVAMDDSGYIYTTEYAQHRIQKFNAQGNFIKTWQIPTDPNRGGGLACLAVHDTILYITYVYSSEVISYSTNGDSLGSVLLPTVINGFGYGGWDITIDRHGNIYVAVLNEVYVLDNKGNLIKSFPLVPGSSTDPDPRCIAIDTTGNVSVACLTDMLIRVYNQNGNYIAKWGVAGTGVGQFTSFSSMIIAPDNSVFVSDGNLARIQKFTRNK